MNEIIDLAKVRADRQVRPRLIVALDDGLYAFLPHGARRWRGADGRIVSYVPLHQLPVGVEPDIVIGEYVPSAPDRVLLLQSIEYFYEIDKRGRVYRNGELLWSEPLAAYGTPRLWLLGQFRVGQEAGLLFASREEDGWNMRIFVTDPVLIVGRHPALHRTRFVVRDWLTAALYALPKRVSAMAPDEAEARGEPTTEPVEEPSA